MCVRGNARMKNKTEICVCGRHFALWKSSVCQDNVEVGAFCNSVHLQRLETLWQVLPTAGVTLAIVTSKIQDLAHGNVEVSATKDGHRLLGARSLVHGTGSKGLHRIEDCSTLHQNNGFKPDHRTVAKASIAWSSCSARRGNLVLVVDICFWKIKEVRVCRTLDWQLVAGHGHNSFASTLGGVD